MMRRHFVEFQCPGTLMEEESRQPIDAWDVDTALKRAQEVRVRHGQRPHSFRFITRERGDDELDSRVTARSARHFIGGVVETLEEIEARAAPEERVLRENMRGNGWARVVRTTSGGSKWTHPMHEDDVIVGVREERAAAMGAELAERAREAAHHGRERHGGADEAPGARAEGPWREHYEEAMREHERATREHFAEFAKEGFETLSPQGRCAVERLEECVIERDIPGLDAAARALGEHAGHAELGELGARLEALDDPGERENARTLARLWRNRLRDHPLPVRAQDALAVEVAATAMGGAGGRIVEESTGRITVLGTGETATQVRFRPDEWWGTGALARARLGEEAVGKLGYEPDEVPDDEPGLDALRAGVRERTVHARALYENAPLHERLHFATSRAGYDACSALILEQAAAGPCLDAPFESTLARARGAMLEPIDPERRVREDCVRAILSAAREILDPPEARRANRREVQVGAMGEALERTHSASAALAALVRAAERAGATAGIGHIKPEAFAGAAHGVEGRAGAMLAEAAACRRAQGQERQGRERA